MESEKRKLETGNWDPVPTNVVGGIDSDKIRRVACHSRTISRFLISIFQFPFSNFQFPF